MRRLLHVLTFCVLIGLVSCGPSGAPDKSNGKLVTKEERVKDFKAVVLKVPATLFIQQTGKEGLEIEAEESQIGKLSIKVEGGVLEIGIEKNGDWRGMFWGTNITPTEKPITLFLTVKELNSIILDGAGDITTEGLIKSDKMEIKLSGSGTVHFDLNGKELTSTISGTGALFLTGDVDEQDLKISGSGKYEADDLKSKDAKIKISGSGDVVVHVKEKLSVDISGSGNVSYQGRPKIKQNISGSGVVQRLEK